jgi:hypothetical protein
MVVKSQPPVLDVAAEPFRRVDFTLKSTAATQIAPQRLWPAWRPDARAVVSPLQVNNAPRLGLALEGVRGERRLRNKPNFGVALRPRSRAVLKYASLAKLAPWAGYYEVACDRAIARAPPRSVGNPISSAR